MVDIITMDKESEQEFSNTVQEFIEKQAILLGIREGEVVAIMIGACAKLSALRCGIKEIGHTYKCLAATLEGCYQTVANDRMIKYLENEDKENKEEGDEN